MKSRLPRWVKLPRAAWLAGAALGCPLFAASLLSCGASQAAHGHTAEANAAQTSPAEHSARVAEPPELNKRGASAGSGGSAKPATAHAASANGASANEANTGSSAGEGAQKHTRLDGYELTWALQDAQFGEIRVVAWVPARSHAEQRLPVLLAFHGRGESKKGPELGVRGWLDDYRLKHSLQRLQAPPLTRSDFLGAVAPQRLSELNQRLAARAYRPLIVVTPYLPDVLKRAEAFENTERLSRIMVDQVLPWAYQATPALGTPQNTGIDGVSLGGRAALLIGLSRPAAFGAVGALQAALDEQELGVFVRLATQAKQRNPELKLRLLTSWGDSFLDVNRKLHARLQHAGVTHELLVVQGNHSYDFNRGPGGIEMLLFHEAALYGN